MLTLYLTRLVDYVLPCLRVYIPQSLKKEGSSSELQAVDPRWEALLTLRSAVDEL